MYMHKDYTYQIFNSCCFFSSFQQEYNLGSHNKNNMNLSLRVGALKQNTKSLESVGALKQNTKITQQRA
jgi:hypothetical protein